MASRNFWRTALRFIVTKQKHIIRNGPNDFGIHRKNCTSTLSEKGCFMSSSFKKLSKLHQGCLKTKCVWVPLMPKIQCWIPSHVPGLLLMSWEILALESSMIGNSQIYTQFSSFWPRDTVFSIQHQLWGLLQAWGKNRREHTCIYNVNYKFTICACHLVLSFHINRREENFPRLIRGLRKVDHYNISLTKSIITVTGTKWHIGAAGLGQLCLHHPWRKKCCVSYAY